MKNQQEKRDDETDVREYINVIIRRKKLILWLVFIVAVIAAISNLLAPRIYEINSTIQLGSVNGLLIKNEEAKAIILNQNSLSAVIKNLNLKAEVADLQKDIKASDITGTNLLRIRITFPVVETAFKINDAVLNPLIAQGQDLYQQKLAILNERLKELESEIKNVEGDINRTQSLISGLPNSNNVPQSDISLRIILLQNTLPAYESNLTSLKNQRNGLKLILADARDFRMVDQPIMPKYPVGPEKMKNVLVSGMTGLMIGVFLAFILEFWQKGKK
jgi:uncharacterized protein involved in exopolysaccharide biosynthesis